MAFWFKSTLSAALFMQYFIWLSNLLFVLLWLQKIYKFLPFEVNLKHIYIDQFIFYNLHLVIRSFIIAVRYGYCSDMRYQVLRSSRKDAAYIGSDFFMNSWINFSPEALDLEIEAAMWRN